MQCKLYRLQCKLYTVQNCSVQCADYSLMLQQNPNVRPFAEATGAHMSANAYQIAMVPIMGYTRLKEGAPVIKVGWIFLSDDLGHDYQQVSEIAQLTPNSARLLKLGPKTLKCRWPSLRRC